MTGILGGAKCIVGKPVIHCCAVEPLGHIEFCHSGIEIKDGDLEPDKKYKKHAEVVSVFGGGDGRGPMAPAVIQEGNRDKQKGQHLQQER